jgi:hypothetical protein
LNRGAVDLVESYTNPEPGKSFSDWSRDGRTLIYTQMDAKSDSDIWFAALDAEKLGAKRVKVVGTNAMDGQGQLSPDGKWLAYCSFEGGTAEVYVRSFPSGPVARKVSIGRSNQPRWRSDGRELFFGTVHGSLQDWTIMAASVKADGHGGLELGVPQRLFDAHYNPIIPSQNIFAYSPHPDGQRFLVNALPEEADVVNVVTNWVSASLKR